MKREKYDIEKIQKYLIQQINKEMSIDIDEKENLLNIGLNSLTVMKIVSFWKKEGYRVKFSELIKNPSIEKWAELLYKSEKVETTPDREIIQNMYEPFNMTDVQYAYWIGRGKEQFLGSVGCHGYFEVDCIDLDFERVQSAWKILFEYHPMLRAKFLPAGKQVIMKAAYQEHITTYDFSGSSSEQQEKSLLELREKLSHRLLKIEEGQVIALAVSLLGSNKFRLHFDIDLLVCDVQSFQIILRDFAAYYAKDILPRVKKEWNFASYLKRQQIHKKLAEQEDKKFWEEKQKLLPKAPKLPVLNEQIIQGNNQFKRHSWEVSAAKANILKKRANEKNVTLAMVLLTAYGYVMSKWSENKKFLMNVPLFNRDMDAEIDNVVADFTNLILVQMDFEKKKSFNEYVQEVQKEFQQSIDHSAYSGIQIMRDLKKIRDSMSFAPIVFSCNLGKPLLSKDFKKVFGEITYMISQTPQVLIDFQLFTVDEGMLFIWDVIDQAFPEGVVAEMFEAMTKIVDSLSDKNTSWDDTLELLSSSQEKHRENAIAFQAEKQEGKTLIENIIKHAASMPNSVALIDPTTKEHITYKELVEYSQNLSGMLIEKGIKKGDRVAIIAERNKESIMAMIAVQNCGCAYIPIHALQPATRVEAILGSASTDFVMASKENRDKLSMLQHVKWIDVQSGMKYDKPYKQIDAKPDSPAYIIFTSGSTGVPKGVEITHRAAMNTIETINTQYCITHKDTAIGVSSFDFDLSVYDIFGMLNVGAKLILVPQSIWRDASAWTQILKEYQVTVWNSVPTLMKMLLVEMEYQNITMDSLTIVFLSGDWIGLDIPERLENSAPRAKLIAMGGATEASIWSNYIEVKHPISKKWKSIPYGMPLKNQFYRIVDAKGEDCPDYVNGELWIGGAGVAKGYVGDKELTYKKFVDAYGKKWYRTGDVGRFWKDGTIEFIGRMDNQVKVRGHRIELGEIESQIKEHSNVEDCAVITIDQKESKMLVAMLVLNRLKDSDEQKNVVSLSKTIIENMSMEDYNAAEDKEFLDYCMKRRKAILFQIITTIEKANVQILDEYIERVQNWKNEIFEYEPKQMKEHTAKSKRLDTFLKPFIESMGDILSNKLKRNEIILKNDFISPNTLAQKTQGGLYTTKVFCNLVENYMKNLKGEPKRKLKVLEVGAKSVDMTLKILNSFCDIDYVLLDSSKYYLKQAKNTIGHNDNVRYVVGNLEDINISQIQNESFDLILLNNTLHQFEDINEILQKIEDYLSEDGLIAFSEMSVPFPLEDISTAFFQKDYTDQRQESGNMLLTKVQWIELIQSIGMELAAVYPGNAYEKEYPQYVYMLRSHKKSRQAVIKAIERFIKQKVPSYMVPQTFYCVAALPVTENGKIDRKKLTSVFANTESEETYTGAMTKTEEQLSEIWEKLLNIKVQKNSNYFRLGGDSLVATQLSAEIEKTFKIDFSIEMVFKRQAFSDMAEYIDEVQKTQENTGKHQYKFVMDEENRFEPFPLTDVQQAYWFGRNNVFQFGRMSTQCYFEMDCQNIDLKKAQDVFNRLIKKHDMLRGVIVKDGQSQKILEKVPCFEMKQYDFTNRDEKEQKNKLLAIRDEMAHKKYDIYQWPLFDIRGAKLSDGTSRIFTSFDNILFDGWSMFYILKEWNYLYHNEGEEVLTSRISFRDYVLNCQMMRRTGLYERDWTYWKQKIKEIYPAPHLPVKVGISGEHKFHRFHKKISRHCWANVKVQIKNYAITPAAFLLSVYAEIIARWSRSEKFSINLTHFNRVPFHKDIEKLVGDFTALTIYGIDMNAASSFLERTKTIQQKLWEDLNHPYVSGVEIERYLNKSSGSGAMPIVFTCGLGLEQSLERDYKGYLGEMTYGLSQTPQVWLDNQVSEENGELEICWDTLIDIFPDKMVLEMFNAYTALIEELSHDQSLWIDDDKDLIQLPNKELCKKLNETSGQMTKGTLMDCFYKTVESYAEHLAVETHEKTFTYSQINEISNAVAKKLLEKGVEKGDVIAILLPKGWEQIASILAILKCGAIYLPLKYGNPYLRNKEIIERAGVTGLLISSGEEEVQKGYESLAWTLPIVEAYDTENIKIKTLPKELAYIIYTSGTTGIPKGVAITNEGALNTIHDINLRLKVTCKDKTLAISDISFDLSVYDIFGMFVAGGSIVMPDSEKTKEPSHWLELIYKHHITLWNTVPMYMQMYTGYLQGKQVKQKQDIRAVLLSGDWIPLTIKEDMNETIGGCELYGLGGATEASIWSNIFKIDEVHPNWGSIPYGKPLTNQRYYIYNRKMQACPNNVPGDLYIAGTGLAECYWKDEENTTSSFLVHSKTKERLYRTGDLALYMPDGNIAFCGRSDNQVKINGFRVELSEVDSILGQMDEVEKAVSMIERNAIVTFVIAEKAFSIEQAINKLKQYLPDYMIPKKILFIDAIPLTWNGKVDRKKLQALSAKQQEHDIPEEEMTLEEKKMGEIWQKILGVQRVKVHENFIAAGGDSLKAVQAISEIQKKFNVEVSLNDFYKNPTISGLTDFILKADGDSEQGEI